ncbi:MAG TPA: FKBP-type peptidyl-prolyl cis-trans isomerase [Williamwhitmania sp.]|nr:FKBP-type peptidyl-prolyl cis-trans isomerase [Williamwhitmania sp.]
MKLKLIISLGLIFMGKGLFAQLTTFEDSVAYSYGSMIGSDLKNKGVELNPDMIAKGIKESTQGTQLLNEQEMNAVLGRYQQEMMAKMQAKQDSDSKKNLAAAAQFLAENSKKPNVVTLPSGLQYEVVKSGDPKGVHPTADDEVSVNYEGSLVDGKVFDSSFERGEPISIKVGKVIPGWQEALQLMKPGDTYMLYIPPQLAYGEKGAGGVIGPNEMLIFKIELLSITPKIQMAPNAPADISAPATPAKPETTTKPTKKK